MKPLSSKIVWCSAREVFRSPAYYGILFLCLGITLTSAVVPVRFRDPFVFAQGSFHSTQVLYGVLFAALFCLPQFARKTSCFRSANLGPLPISGPALSQLAFLGRLLPLTLGFYSLVLAQMATAWLLPVIHNGRLPEGFCIHLATSIAPWAWLQIGAFCALATFIGSVLPRVVANLALFAALVATPVIDRFAFRLSESGEFGARFVAALIPSMALFEPPGIRSSSEWGWDEGVALFGCAAILCVLSNFLTGWILENENGVLPPLDPTTGKP